MPESLEIVLNASLALGAAFVAGLAARRLGLPALVGYILAGVALGPFTPGPVGDLERIGALASVGIVLLLFEVGVELSFGELWRAGRWAVLAAVVQVALTLGLAAGLVRLLGWGLAGALFAGAAVAISSTVVVARLLTDSGELGSSHGRLMMSWLVTQDLLTVALVAILPPLVAEGVLDLEPALGVLARTAVFVVGMVILGRYVIPRILLYVNRWGSRELFLLAATSLALGTALVSNVFFGLSLALGAFVAGLVISESEITHHLRSEMLPLREVFAVLFFVAVGMLVDPSLLWRAPGQVLALLGAVVLIKGAVVAVLTLLLAFPLGTGLLVAGGMAQMGEFSFVLAELGRQTGGLGQAEHGVVLLVAILSILASSYLYGAARWAAGRVREVYWVRPRVELLRQRLAPLEQAAGHVIICGWGRVGRHAAEVFRRLEIPHVVIELSPERVEGLRETGSPFIYGDSTRPETLERARVREARLLLVALPDAVAAYHAAEAGLRLNPSLQVVARGGSILDAEELLELGAQEVVVPTFEGALEMVRQALIRLGYAPTETQRYVDSVRHEHYRPLYAGREQVQQLSSLADALRVLEIEWMRVEPWSTLAGRSLVEARVRERSGASVVAVVRDALVMPNPSPEEPVSVGDILAVMGTPEERERFRQLCGLG